MSIPDPALLTDKGREMLAMLPPYMREDADVLAQIHADAKEAERQEAMIEEVRDQQFPQRATVLLGAWEEVVGLPADGPEALATRRDAVIASLRKLAQGPSGLAWIDLVTKMVGAGWAYLEHDPDDDTTPPNYTLHVFLPQPAGSLAYNRARDLLRATIGAHLHLVVEPYGGFVLDQSELDQTGLG